MVRPPFPKVYHASQLPDIKTISELIVVVNDVWKVGDSVDWFTDGCFWCGRIKEMLGKEMARIELLPPPAGEGLSYEVYCKDLRPSLDWSPVDGWTLPSKGSKSYHSCVHLMKPQSQVSTLSEGKEGVLVEAGSLLQHGISNASRFSAGAEPFLEMSEQSTKPAASRKKISTSEEISNKLPDSGKKKYDESGHSKRIKTDEKICLNSTRSATMEAAIIDLEELISRVKWLKGILDLGTPTSDTARSSWKFQEHRPSATPK
ncbi:hypothetical protein SLEP1_g434 [Rubroshorea leprosula]|uniref:Agenet domain-containing protein n=1 Tax=Rubroshorea leprosula TaxID=152421 RepID=A0AAV5HJG1_9ROSI|nr:hypothetical protein SLEP1_g434 [Rubroshorea leprosula]